jgi:hypothetical protein
VTQGLDAGRSYVQDIGQQVCGGYSRETGVRIVFDNARLIEQAPLQDVDLLQRLNQYFATLDMRLRQGQGWVIYNAGGVRASRITKFMAESLRGVELSFSHYFLPWREFALTSYLVEVELQNLPERESELSERSRKEYAIATRVSRQTLAQMVTSDLLILSGLIPQHEHEVQYLTETIERRYNQRLATILMTPEQPHELARDVARLAHRGEETWSWLSERLYATNLVAV